MTTRADHRPFVTGALLAAVLLLTHLGFGLLPSVFDPLVAQSTDRLFALRDGLEGAAPPLDPVVVHVDVDDRSLQELGELYLDRGHHARLVRNLHSAGVAAQLHDVIFAAPQVDAQDRALEDATREAGNVYYGMALGLEPGGTESAGARLDAESRELLARRAWKVRVEGDASSIYSATRLFTTFPALSAAARGSGFLDIRADRDGVYRRAPLLARYGDGFLPSAALLAVCDYLGVAPEDVLLEPGRALTLRGARRPGAEQARDIAIPVDRHGRMIVNFLGPWGAEEGMPHFPFSGVYQASDDRFAMMDLRDELEGRIALVAWVATGSGDIGPVPTDPLFPLVGLHSNVINTILTGSFLRELSSMQMLFGVELPLLAMVLLASLRLSTVPFIAAAAALAALYYGAAALAFFYGDWILNLPRPLAALAGSTLVVAAYQFHLEAQARSVLRSRFDCYFPPSVVSKIMARAGGLGGEAQKKELTILFSDIKSFTTHTANMEADHLRRLLNEYFERMVDIVFEHEGTVDKFIGDGLMVFFGDPEDQPDHALRCVRAAIDMQEAARRLQREWTARGDMPLQIRIGINTGEVTVGDMGSARRLSYTVLGAPVNMAQRLESNAPVGGILISERTWELVKGAVEVRRREPIRVKGIDELLTVYEVPVDREAGAGIENRSS